MKNFLTFLGLLAVVYALAVQHGAFYHRAPTAPGGASSDCIGNALVEAYRTHRSRIEVCGHGTVAKVLREDLQGSRHQRFIVRLDGGQSLLIAYNIDIAPRIESLQAGTPIDFSGEYEWNGQGGVVHWTHHDPGGRHPDGWIRYEGRTYR